MNRLVILALAFLASGVMARPLTFLSSLTLTPTIEQPPTQVTGCTDFSGSWDGSCSAGGQQAKEAFTIKQQGCEMIEIDSPKAKITLPIGGVFSAGGAMPGTPASSFGGSLESSWNKEKTTLSITALGGFKKLAIDEASQGAMINETVRVIGGKLLIDLSAHASQGSMTTSCEFDKIK